MSSRHSEALELAKALGVMVNQIAEKKIGDFEHCTNGYLHDVVTFLAEYVESISVPEGSLSMKQRQAIVGTLLYGLNYVDVERDRGDESVVINLKDSFGSLKDGIDIFCALIEQEKKLYRTGKLHAAGP